MLAQKGESRSRDRERPAGEVGGDPQGPFSRSQGIPSTFPECLLNACAWCQDFRDEGILFSGVSYPGMNKCAVSYLLSE